MKNLFNILSRARLAIHNQEVAHGETSFTKQANERLHEALNLIDQQADKPLDVDFVNQVEASHFRTVDDAGGNEAALMIWNVVRKRVGLPRLNKSDLPAYCFKHKVYHVIDKQQGCEQVKY